MTSSNLFSPVWSVDLKPQGFSRETILGAWKRIHVRRWDVRSAVDENWSISGYAWKVEYIGCVEGLDVGE